MESTPLTPAELAQEIREAEGQIEIPALGDHEWVCVSEDGGALLAQELGVYSLIPFTAFRNTAIHASLPWAHIHRQRWDEDRGDRPAVRVMHRIDAVEQHLRRLLAMSTRNGAATSPSLHVQPQESP